MAQDSPRGIAIVGMACRFPGAADAAAFWKNLEHGVDCIRHFTDEELLAAGVPKRLLSRADYVKAAPVVDHFDKFDAEFFEYSPREARLMDPQQRLLLEEAWRALEDAGHRSDRNDRDVGVFMGSGGVVTSYLLAQPALHRAATGSLEHLANDKDFVSTKLSYKLGLTGPSINVQTACSTSMVAVHLACQSILDGECDMALAGAATVRVPQIAGYVHRTGDIMSPDGRCRAYDAAAEGTVFGSGVGVIALKHVEDAVADGDRIYAVILGSAINNDGDAKMSYTASSTDGQARAMARAFAAADVSASTIGMVEGHGTGTVVGDPLEVEALRRCFAIDTAVERAYLGSVKTNIGHLEQTAGVASLIKTALALHHGKIPPSLNFETPNPRIDFAGGPFEIPTKVVDWEAGATPRRAGVNSLGLGGTNGFAILQEAPERIKGPATQPPVMSLGFSARSRASLQALGEAWKTTLTGCTEAETAALCATSLQRRSPERYRRSISSSSTEGLISALARPQDAVTPARSGRKIALLFPGQGAQYTGMARELLDSSEVFRTSFDATAARLKERAGIDIQAAIYDAVDAQVLKQTSVLQPALFAIEIALADVLADFGVHPDAVLGHSVGAYAAMVVAGIYERADATDLIARRAQLMGDLPSGGAMLALFANADETRALLDPIDGATIAAMNSPLSTAVSGTEKAIAALEEAANSADIGTQRLSVSHAFHSPLMAPVAEPLADTEATYFATAPTIPFISDLTGEALSTAPEPGYLAEHVLQPVRFADGLRALGALGCTDFIEVGPGRALSSFAKATLSDAEATVHATLDPQGSDWLALVGTVGQLWQSGHVVDPGRLNPRDVPHRDMPLYPFNRKRYWLEQETGAETGSDGLAGSQMSIPGEARHFQSTYSVQSRPWLADHRIYGHVTLPVAAALLALAEAGGKESDSPCEVRGLTYHAPMLVPDEAARRMHLTLVPEGDGVSAQLSSQMVSGAQEWTEHVTAQIHNPSAEDVSALNLSALRQRLSTAVDVGKFYTGVDGIGLNYGPLFRAVRKLTLGNGEALAEISIEPGANDPDPHPALFDACLHIFAAVSSDHGTFEEDAPDVTATFLPVTIERFWTKPSLPRAVCSHCVLREGEDPATGRFTVDIAICDADGARLAGIEGLTVRRIEGAAFAPTDAGDVNSWLYKVAWKPRPALETPAGGETGHWLVIGWPCQPVNDLIEAFSAAGRGARLVAPDDLAAIGPEDRETALTGLVLATALCDAPLMTLDADTLAASARAQFETSQAILSYLNDGNFAGSPRLWILTRGAQAPLDDDLGGEALQSVLWGHGRVLSLEHSNLWGGLIDLDHRTPVTMAVHEILNGDAEDQIALRGGQRFAPRLSRHEPVEPGRTLDAPIRLDASYLITGGLGTLGLKVADWLVTRHGARHLWLVSRRAPSAEQSAAIAALEHAGAHVHIASVDIGEATQVVDLTTRINAEGPALGGVFHCAGLLDDGVMLDMSWEQYHRVTASKIEGTWALHSATEALALDHFVLFSSILSVIGSMGQLNYVSGNAFQDGLVAYRRRLGLPAAAMNWGPWEDAGLATESGDRGRAIWRARGTEYIPAGTGLEAMELALAGGIDHAVVTLTDWPRFVGQFANVPAFYEELTSGSDHGRARIHVDTATLMQDLAVASPSTQHALIAAALGEICAANLELETAPDPDLALREAGLDSLMSITVIDDIEQVFGTRLSARALLRGPSINELATMVHEALSDLPTIRTKDQPDPAPKPKAPAGKPGAWLVTATPRPDARMRMFCFPFAGGGSAVFDNWGTSFDPSIEIVAVEAPGRLGRINEEPVRTVEAFARALMPELTGKLDRPYAVLGHCLGGLTLYETLRFVQARDLPMPQHIFVSGARPPSVLRAPGDFERELEERLRTYRDYRSAEPVFEQSDDVFAEIVRAFGISDSDKMLEEEELRALILPTVRAEFEMSSRYIYLPEAPFDVPITCFRGSRDSYVRALDAKIWSRFTTRKFELFTRETGHFAIVEDFDFIRKKIEERLFERQTADT